MPHSKQLINPLVNNNPSSSASQVDLLMQAPVAIAIFQGESFMIVMANDLMLQLWDKPRDAVLNRPFLEAHPELRGQGFDELMKQVAETGQPLVVPEAPVMVKRNGAESRIYVKLSFVPLRENTGEITGVMATAADITDIVNSKFALEESQKQFANAFMESPMGMAILRGPDFVIETVNDEMLTRFWHRSEAEVKGKGLFKLFPELATQKYPELLNKVLTTGEIHREKDAEALIYDGYQTRRFYIDFEYRPLKNNAGSVSGIMVTAYDVTDNMLVRQKLEEEERRSRLAIKAASLGTFEWDLKTQNFRYSDRLAQIFRGSSNHDFSHEDLIKLIHPDDMHLRNQGVAEVFRTGAGGYRVRLIWPDRSIHWVSVYGLVAYDKNGDAIRMYGAAVDISLEAQYQRALEESEEKFRSLANFLPTFIWTIDPAGNLTYVNQSILAFSGLSEEEIRQGAWHNLLHPDDRAKNIQKLELSLMAGHDFEAELRFRNKEGEYRWQLGRVIALKNDVGDIQMWIGTGIDIHDQKTMAEELEKRVAQRTAELKEANEELLRANQDLEQFAYVSSHDLQEPLRKIQTFSGLVLSRLQPMTADVKTYIEKIGSSADRMSVLINDLLNYSRVSKGDEKFVAVDLNQVLKNVLSDFEVLIQQKNAHIICAGLPAIKAIPIQINQLFFNLISNALKFSEVEPVISIVAEEIGIDLLPANIPLPSNRAYLRLSFKDNGIGFDQSFASQIFTIFQRLNNRKQYSGTGIGLAVCKKIAENHQGYIFATSQPGKGAEFTVYLSR